MPVMDVHVVDLVSISLWSASARDTQASPQSSLCEGLQLHLAGHSKQCPVLLPFIRQEGDVFIQQDNTPP